MRRNQFNLTSIKQPSVKSPGLSISSGRLFNSKIADEDFAHDIIEDHFSKNRHNYRAICPVCKRRKMNNNNSYAFCSYCKSNGKGNKIIKGVIKNEKSSM